jgi:hypothetical protein
VPVNSYRPATDEHERDATLQQLAEKIFVVFWEIELSHGDG